MRTRIFKDLIGCDEVIVDDARIDREKDCLVIKVRPFKVRNNRCPLCHQVCSLYDRGVGVRRWRCSDFGNRTAFVEAAAPRIRCKEHGILVAEVPWAAQNSGFTYCFEERVGWLSVHTSRTAVSELMRIDWHTVGSICKRVFDRLLQRATDEANSGREEQDRISNVLYDGLVNIGIDETSYKKGHKYLTVVVNHDTNTVVWAAPGHDEDTLSSFFKMLTTDQRNSIRCVSGDGAAWIAACVRKYCPNAERCMDPFHVVQWATDELDLLRRKVFVEEKKALEDQYADVKGKKRRCISGGNQQAEGVPKGRS